MEMTLAGRGVRLAATFIDVLPLIVVQLMRSWLNIKGTGNGPLMTVYVAFLLIVIVYVVYQFSILIRDGQTLGKKIMRIKIVDVNTGMNGGFVPNVLKRSWLNGVLNIIPFYFFVDSLFIFRDDRRCLHDIIAGTKVVVV